MKKIQNNYKKSGVNISLANKFVDHIAKISKKNDQKTNKLLIQVILGLWFSF